MLLVPLPSIKTKVFARLRDNWVVITQLLREIPYARLRVNRKQFRGSGACLTWPQTLTWLHAKCNCPSLEMASFCFLVNQNVIQLITTNSWYSDSLSGVTGIKTPLVKEGWGALIIVVPYGSLLARKRLMILVIANRSAHETANCRERKECKSVCKRQVIPVLPKFMRC